MIQFLKFSETNGNLGYQDYQDALKILKLEPLNDRREKLLLKYGKQCTSLEQTKELFPLKKKSHSMNTRNNDLYEEVRAHTTRFKNSTVPYIQRLMNKETTMRRPPG